MNLYCLKNIKLFTIVGLTIIFAGCNKIEQLTGKIINSNNQGIENVSIEILNESIKLESTKDGTFQSSIKHLKDTSFITLKISAENYLDKYIALDNYRTKSNEIKLIKKSELANKILNDEKLKTIKKKIKYIRKLYKESVG